MHVRNHTSSLTLCACRAELCVVYHSAVLRVERHVLTDCTATVASIQFYLSEYVNILPGVHTFLYEIMTLPNRTDAAVMSLLFDRAHCGNPSLKAVLERLLWNCNQVMYAHLCAWCALTLSVYCFPLSTFTAGLS